MSTLRNHATMRRGCPSSYLAILIYSSCSLGGCPQIAALRESPNGHAPRMFETLALQSWRCGQHCSSDLRARADDGPPDDVSTMATPSSTWQRTVK